MWGYGHDSIRAEQKGTLSEDCNCFELCKMIVRTDQLLCIAKATGSKVYPQESEAEAHDWAKKLVLSLKQYHT